MPVSLYAVTLDCSDAKALATFWSGVLDRPVDEGASDEFAAIGLADPGAQRPLGCSLGCRRATRQSQEPGHPRLRRGCPACVQDLVTAVRPGSRISAVLLRPGPRPSEAGVAPH
jgi:hypothetical protein